MRVFVIGTRGFPDIQGGVEQHCENLYPLLASDECQITVFRRRPYVVDKTKEFGNIIFKDLPSTKIPGFEALYHSFLASIICILKRPDIVHVHNIGPGFFIPILRAAGLKVILTYHSPNYEHVKWSVFTRLLLKYSEYMSVRYSNKVIFVSLYQKVKLGNKANFVHINNGVKVVPLVNNEDYIRELDLQKKKYVLAVGRFVEEKGFDLLINAFSNIVNKDFHLVIAGDSDHETVYSTRLKELAKKHNVILPGFVRGKKLQQLYVHAGLFVLPSYNEGQPLSLLEAMSCNLPVLASNIPANLQVALPAASYFTSGDIISLTEKLDQKLHGDLTEVEYDMTDYNWNHIAVQTKEVYARLLKK